ncbi:MAG: D-aminoacyl-tRNA deacylase [Verrucomicrobia subdivision 3 bacterium]|nr:D-aminoacyl-tRNA deacylase [Limisphaerales bacterium]MCS1413042.1 D-aminoacyl-tRNA deacylase [Limisphaerales bacterium]
MRVLLQRVREARVEINGVVRGEIGCGLLLFLGIEGEDTEEDVRWLCSKIVQMRIFSDNDGKMNLSLIDVSGNVLMISQFTLHASTKKGNRPSYIRAATPEVAIPLYEKFIRELELRLGHSVPTGEFGADMQVSLINDGPVTIMIDSKRQE